MKRIAISIGDGNGIGPEIALRAHATIAQWCEPLYCVDEPFLERAAELLGVAQPSDMCCHPLGLPFEIAPGQITAISGAYAYASFVAGIHLTEIGVTEALVTLPIHKKAWQLAGIPYAGHTEMLETYFGQEAIMMIGCHKRFALFFTHHIPLRHVARTVRTKRLFAFLMRVYAAIPQGPIGVLGLNPHAGDNGVIGGEEKYIARAVAKANKAIGTEIFVGPLVPDAAFIHATPRILVCMYHDQCLGTLKSHYFEEGINVTLGIPIVRTSVDHGTAFDIAYRSNTHPLLQSYLEAVTAALKGMLFLDR